MSYQECPHCKGSGRTKGVHKFWSQCNVCAGYGIISQITGKPPKETPIKEQLPPIQLDDLPFEVEGQIPFAPDRQIEEPKPSKQREYAFCSEPSIIRQFEARGFQEHGAGWLIPINYVPWYDVFIPDWERWKPFFQVGGCVKLDNDIKRTIKDWFVRDCEIHYIMDDESTYKESSLTHMPYYGPDVRTPEGMDFLEKQFKDTEVYGVLQEIFKDYKDPTDGMSYEQRRQFDREVRKVFSKYFDKAKHVLNIQAASAKNADAYMVCLDVDTSMDSSFAYAFRAKFPGDKAMDGMFLYVDEETYLVKDTEINKEEGTVWLTLVFPDHVNEDTTLMDASPYVGKDFYYHSNNWYVS